VDLAVNPVAGFGREAIVVLEFVATMAFALSGVIGAAKRSWTFGADMTGL
jgi:hypothetical protein